MPVTPTYPGVYVEEIPSGVRTIAGVATSITAFIGRAKRGPVNEATIINSFGDFERIFGGLDLDSTMSYTVRDFYLNGGSQAIIVRLYVAKQAPALAPPALSDTQKTELLTATKDEGVKPIVDAAAAGPNPPNKESAKTKFAELQSSSALLTNQRKLEDEMRNADAANQALQLEVAKFQELSHGLTAQPPPTPPITSADISKQADAVLKKEADLGDAQKALSAARFTVAKDQIKIQAAQQALDKINSGASVDANAIATGLVDAKMKSMSAAAKAPAGTASAGVGDVSLAAASPGTWANKLIAKVDHKGIDDKVAERFRVEKSKLFNLTIIEKTGAGAKVALETFQSLSVDSQSSRRVDRVLSSESDFARFAGEWDTTSPPASPTDGETEFSGGDDGAPLGKLQDFIGEAATDVGPGTGLHLLDTVDLFNLLCIPPDTRDGDLPPGVSAEAMSYCARRRAMYIVDPPTPGKGWRNANSITKNNNQALTDLGLSGTAARNTAIFFPRIQEADQLRDGQTDIFVPCGVVAGIMARTDRDRGVWKAAAGIDAAMNGVQGLAVELNDDENGMLNPLGINCLRSFPVFGRVVWGARTLRGADQLADEYKYIAVRRTALFIEESLFRGLKWVVFEPNDEPLWAQIRLNVGAFMQNMFRQGAFQGKTPREAYFVKCDKETTTQNDINLGIVNVVVGFAPLKPAEFVIIKIQQMAGQIDV